MQVRGIVGSNGTTTVSDLYLQYKANKLIYLGNDGKYTISADGGQYSGNAATATKAVNDNNNHPITDYIKDVTYSVAATGDKVSFNFQRGSSNVFTHSITGATTAAAGLVTTGAQTFKGIKTFSSGTKMGVSTWVNWLDSGKFTANNANEPYPYDCGGLKWAEQSDAISLYAQATKRDNLDLVLSFGDDNSNSFRITDKEKTTTITMTATGDITASNFYGLASKAKADENGNQLTKTYIASLKYEAQTNTSDAANLPSIKGIAMDGETVISTIPLLSASAGNNGLVSTTAQTFGGNKTFKDNLAVTGNTALTGTLGVTGKTTLSDALDVTGTTTLKSTLGVIGNTTLGGTLGVTGATTLTGNLTANGSVTMAQSLTISGIINSLVEKSAPFVVKSTTLVENLNADKVDGYDVINTDFTSKLDSKELWIPSIEAIRDTFLPLLQSIQGLRYRGAIDLSKDADNQISSDILNTVKVGDVFMISIGGIFYKTNTYLEPADMLICVAKSGSVITWNHIQSNINGAVTIKGAIEKKEGANSLVSVDSIPVFSAVTGRQITGSKIFIDGAGHLLPASGNTQQCLGSKERKWITVWANTFQGTDFNGTNFTGTTFKGTDFTGTIFTGTTFTGNAASASKWKNPRTITVKGADTGSVILDGSQDVVLTLNVAHTHNYAGSDKSGGAAYSANKLNTNAGSATKPVYFSNGIPVECTSLNGNAASADKLSAARTFTIGYTGKSFDGTSDVSWSLGEIGFPDKMLHGTVDTATSAVSYIVTDSSDTKTLQDGKIIYIQLDTTPTKSDGIQINYNGSGYKPVYNDKGYKLTYFYARAGWKLLLIYNANSTIAGGAWECISNPASNWPLSANTTTDNKNYYILGLSGTGNYSINTCYKNDSIYFNPSTGSLYASKVYGAVWNDYAEYRKSNCKIPGKCIIEVGDDTLKLSTKRLQPGAEIISDTFGFAIGKTEECKTPIAVSGRVLAYPYEPLEKFRENIGKPVCSGPNGTVSIMTDEEYQKFGYCAIGTISAVPDYKVWGSGNVKVNGRVWIKV